MFRFQHYSFCTAILLSSLCLQCPNPDACSRSSDMVSQLQSCQNAWYIYLGANSTMSTSESIRFAKVVPQPSLIFDCLFIYSPCETLDSICVPAAIYLVSMCARSNCWMHIGALFSMPATCPTHICTKICCARMAIVGTCVLCVPQQHQVNRRQ